MYNDLHVTFKSIESQQYLSILQKSSKTYHYYQYVLAKLSQPIFKQM